MGRCGIKYTGSDAAAGMIDKSLLPGPKPHTTYAAHSHIRLVQFVYCRESTQLPILSTYSSRSLLIIDTWGP